jgi:hypothetical protein
MKSILNGQQVFRLIFFVGTSKNTKVGVIPAEAGIQASDAHLPCWIPAFAGMTGNGSNLYF